MAMELFLATYTVPNNAVGDYKLFVLLRGAHIKESPFVVHVILVPVGWITCYKCGRRRSGYMKYYKNDNEPSRADDRRVNGYSALCYPDCISYSQTKNQWTLVCGPL